MRRFKVVDLMIEVLPEARGPWDKRKPPFVFLVKLAASGKSYLLSFFYALLLSCDWV
jgi:hypothetical protein